MKRNPRFAAGAQSRFNESGSSKPGIIGERAERCDRAGFGNAANEISAAA